MLRSFDAFARPVDELRKSSIVGGLITILAYTSAFVLFLSQLLLYINVETKQYLQMATSLSSSYVPKVGIMEQIPPASSNGAKYSSQLDQRWAARAKIPVTFHVTFPHMSCQQLEISHDDARREQFHKLHGKTAYKKYIPTRDEMKRTGMFEDSSFTKKNKAANANSCSIRGNIMVPKVGGVFSIGVTPESWQDVVVFLNTGMKDSTRYPGNENPKLFNVRYVVLYGSLLRNVGHLPGR